VVARLSAYKQVACLQDVDACARRHSVEKLDCDRVDKLLCVLEGHFVKVSELALDEEEKLVVQECRLACEE
jgi:hypothetical protein